MNKESIDALLQKINDSATSEGNARTKKIVTSPGLVREPPIETDQAVLIARAIDGQVNPKRKWKLVFMAALAGAACLIVFISIGVSLTKKTKPPG